MEIANLKDTRWRDGLEQYQDTPLWQFNIFNF